MGWELFKNYLIAKEKFKPDFFLYENNHSIAQPIKTQISHEFNVPLQCIDSALVSAQSRKRIYAHNMLVPSPKDRGILLKDILESGITDREKAYCLKHQAGNARDYLKKHHTQVAFEPVRIGTIENTSKNMAHDSKQYRAYSPQGKATTLCGQGGGVGAKTGLYAIPIHEMLHDKPAYKVSNGFITYKDVAYPINLPDGFYVIRKLSVTECCRLQGLPDWWFDGNDGKKLISETQCYKGLGNGWQLDTVKHILSHLPLDKSEPILCLSLYDGIGTGRRILEELGFKDVTYVASEVDKYCIKVTSHRYQDIIHIGDAFQVRDSKFDVKKVVCH